MKYFFVSKNDKNRVDFISKKTTNFDKKDIFVICSNDRKGLYSNITSNFLTNTNIQSADKWIPFIKSINENTILVIDNVLKFALFGDGQKKYIKDISQSIKNIIVTDIVPFYTEPYEIFYPFYFLGKSILGYNSYGTFKKNHLEKSDSGEVLQSHSFDILKDKIKGYYVQDYDKFFMHREIIEWKLSKSEQKQYFLLKEKIKETYTNPINSITKVADFVNLCDTKAIVVSELLEKLNGKTCIVLNTEIYAKKIKSKFFFKEFDILSYHEKDYSIFGKYDNIIFYDNIIVKSQNAFYIEPHIKPTAKCYSLRELITNIDTYLFNRIYGNGLRNSIDVFSNNKL